MVANEHMFLYQCYLMHETDNINYNMQNDIHLHCTYRSLKYHQMYFCSTVHVVQ